VIHYCCQKVVGFGRSQSQFATLFCQAKPCNEKLGVEHISEAKSAGTPGGQLLLKILFARPSIALDRAITKTVS